MSLVMDKWAGTRGDDGALTGFGEAACNTVLGYHYVGDFQDSLTHGDGAYTPSTARL